MGRLIGWLFGLLIEIVFVWLFSACLMLFRKLICWLEMDSGIADWPWLWVLPKLVLLCGIVLALVAGLLLLLNMATGALQAP